MINDLDEAIKYHEEVAESKEKQVKESVWEKGSNTEKRCIECAKEHRQLAEWLKELKKYRRVRTILSQNRIATDRYGEVVLWDDIKRVFEEVNADEDSD